MSQEHKNQLGLDRIAFFSDAVMAIAMTLLVLDLKLPEGWSGDLIPQIVAVQSKLLSFFISFMTIVVSWMAHHRMFAVLRRYDTALIWLNNAFLLFVVFLPFPAAILGAHLNTQTVTLYAINLVPIGLLRTAMWYHATRKQRLVSVDFSGADARAELWRSLASPLCFLVTIPIAFFNAPLAATCWILIWVLSLLLLTRKRI